MSQLRVTRPDPATNTGQPANERADRQVSSNGDLPSRSVLGWPMRGHQSGAL